VGVCTSFAVLRGEIVDISRVAVLDTDESVHTLVSVDVARSWKADISGVPRVRLLEDIADTTLARRRYAPFEIGEDCLLYIMRDSRDEMVASPTSLALRDSVVLGLRGYPENISVEEALAFVDVCADERSPAPMIGRADVIVEGDVVSSWEGWETRERTAASVELANLVVHKGELPVGGFELVNMRRYRGSTTWPRFEPSERVLLFLVEDDVSTYKLIGGWQGAWRFEDDGAFHIGSMALIDRYGIGFVPADQTDRADLLPDRILTRDQLMEALQGG